MNRIFAVGLMIAVCLSGCGKSTSTMSAEFSSMDNCLSAIERKTGLQLEVVTDKFGDVSGFLKGTKLGFQCKTKTSSVKGAMVDGWYMVED